MTSQKSLRDKSHVEQIERWAEFVRDNAGWKKQFKEFSDAQIIIARRVFEKLPEELLTEEEIQKMISSCANLRDRALVSVLYESGCRIGEIGNLRIKDVLFDEYGAKIDVLGKTGARRVR